jgi:hypothetical protein
MARSLNMARPIGFVALIALLATGCAYEKQDGYSNIDDYYGGYSYRADYRSGYYPDEDRKALPRIRPAARHAMMLVGSSAGAA